ncbi:MAG: hypothetical protein ABI844_00890 [Saprospiraceae bacterium]
MKTALITNLGNRNITLDDQVYNTSFVEVSFKDWSKKLWEQYDHYKNDLDINIINPLITPVKPTKIFLFFSDQSLFDTRTDQDTLYEGRIIKQLLIDKYSYLESEVELVKTEAKVIDNGALLKCYRQKLIAIKKENFDSYIICDAGGTAQQKMALKIMMEYLFEPEQYEVKYTENNELISDVNVDEYRSVINSELAISLIHKGDYSGASTLLGYTEIENFHNSNDWKKKLFAFIYFRYHGNHHFANANLSSFNAKHKLLVSYKNSIPLFDTRALDDLMPINAVIDLGDKIQKCLFLLNGGLYSQSILAFAQFYESLFEQYIHYTFDPDIYGHLRSQSAEQENSFMCEICSLMDDEFILCNQRYENYKVSIGNLATQCMLAKHSSYSLIEDFGKLLSPHISYTIDANDDQLINIARNKIAHEGFYITEKIWRTKFKYAEKLILKTIDIFQFVVKDLFGELNNLLEETIRYK